MPPKEFRSLTSYRGFAALTVVLFHLKDYLFYPFFPHLHENRIWHGLIEPGYLAVDYFFILSGFVLTASYARRLAGLNVRKYFEFMILRFARIYPVHLLTLALVIGWFVAVFGSPLWHYSIADLVMNVLLIQDWETCTRRTFSTIAWSISAEWFAYVIFPFLLPLAARFRRALPAALASLGLIAVMLFILRKAGFRDMDVTYHLGLVRVGFEFTAGMLLYKTYEFTSLQTRLHAFIFAACLLGLAGVIVTGKADPWGIPLFALVILSSAVIDARLSWIHRPIFHNIGRWSYSIYMIQILFQKLSFFFPAWIAKTAFPMIVKLGLSSIYVLLIVLAGKWTYELVEAPAQAAIRSWASENFNGLLNNTLTH